nr:MAG TPA: hypothetical protein [Caudoviricetes sp.]
MYQLLNLRKLKKKVNLLSNKILGYFTFHFFL